MLTVIVLTSVRLIEQSPLYIQNKYTYIDKASLTIPLYYMYTSTHTYTCHTFGLILHTESSPFTTR